MKALPLPLHFNPKLPAFNGGSVFRVPYEDRAREARAWAQAHGIQHASKDKLRIAFLGVDIQNTFVTPGFELVVGGAVEDTVRTAEFIYRNLHLITSINPTMDTHTAMQLFHQIFWVDEQGNHPTPGSILPLDEIKSGKWKVNPAVAHSVAGGNYVGLQQHVIHYATELTNGGKYPLLIWPYHAMLGGIGHALVSIFEEAAFFHNIARNSQTGFEIKGGNPLTENYSIFRPEVLTGANGAPIAQKNTRFIQKLLTHDIVVIAGQAKSHCVAWAIDDLLTEITAQDPNLARKVYLLEDCTSPVVIPGVIDFTQQANDAFAKFAAAGMHVVKSTDPIETWPGVNL